MLCEIRFEHRTVLMDDWRAWIPIVFCGMMALAIPLATLAGARLGRYIFTGLYGLTIVIGALGVFLHSEGHLLERLIEVSIVWTKSVQSGAAIQAAHPPLLAPFAFMGLGSIGLIFCFSERDIHENRIAGDRV